MTPDIPLWVWPTALIVWSMIGGVVYAGLYSRQAGYLVGPSRPVLSIVLFLVFVPILGVPAVLLAVVSGVISAIKSR